MPPPAQVGYPSDGARPSALATSNPAARITRVPGQRRHFGGEDSIFMPAGYDIMDSVQPGPAPGDFLGRLPSVDPSPSAWDF